MRLAAGGLLLLSAGIDLVRKPRSDLPSLPGIRAALVPVAVPLFARSALVVAGLSVVADHGLALYAGALIVAVAATAVFLVVAVENEALRLVQIWAGRLLSATAVGGSIVLIAHAVFDL